MVAERKASTATSLAALNTAGSVPPSRPARRAKPQGRKILIARRLERQLPSAEKSSGCNPPA
jgi:hypothetical protein